MGTSSLAYEYCKNISTSSDTVREVCQKMTDTSIPVLELVNFIKSKTNRNVDLGTQYAMATLRNYYEGVSAFQNSNRNQSDDIQVRTIFDLSNSFKFFGTCSVNMSPSIVFIECSNLKDIEGLCRYGTIGFFTIRKVAGYTLPVIVTPKRSTRSGNENNDGISRIITHELTHFRNSILRLFFLSEKDMKDGYTEVVYPRLQDEILARLSEWDGSYIENIHESIQEANCYHFYKDIATLDTTKNRDRFIGDVEKYTQIAREIGKLRPNNYIIDLTLIPMNQWNLYRNFLLRNLEKPSE